MGGGSEWAWCGVKVLWNVQDKIFSWCVNEEVRIGRMGLPGRHLLGRHLEIKSMKHHDVYMRTTLTLEDDVA